MIRCILYVLCPICVTMSVCRAELPTVLRYVYSPVRLSCGIAYCSTLRLFTCPFVVRNCLLFYATSIHPSVCRAELPTVLLYVYSPVRLSCGIAYCSTLRLFTRPFVVRNCLLFYSTSIHPSVCRAELPTVLRCVYSPVRLSCGIAYCSTLRLFTCPFVVRNCLLFYATSIHPSVCRAELPTVLRYVYSPVRLSCGIAYCSTLRLFTRPYVVRNCLLFYATSIYPSVCREEWPTVLRYVYSPVRLSCGIAYCSTLRQCVNAKFDVFQAFIDRINVIKPINVICLQECWLKNHDNVTMFNLTGYDMVYQSGRCCANGGLIIYNLQYTKWTRVYYCH